MNINNSEIPNSSATPFGVKRISGSRVGEEREEAAFIDVDAWGKPAEVIAQYCRKGSELYVEGRLKTDSWDDKATGKKMSKLCVTLEAFQFGAKQGDGAPRAAAKAEAPAASSDDSEIPF